MAITSVLPLFNDKYFSYSTSVDNIAVNITAVWNTRTEHYHLTVSLTDGTIIIEGVKMVVGYPIFTTQSFVAGLSGGFYIFPISDLVEDNAATREALADNYFLTYHA